MPKRSKREEKPAKSNRGRLDARGVFIVFDEPQAEPEPEQRPEDEALARDGDDKPRGSV
jgi:hypothetical protein